MSFKHQSHPEAKRQHTHASRGTVLEGLQHNHRNDLRHDSYDTLLSLQHTIGNRAVQRLLASDKALPQRRAAPSIQRFGAGEHKRIGDDATKDASGNIQMVELAPGYSISYGDMVAVAGDHFRDIEQMRDFARKKGTGAGTRGEIEYVLWDIHGKPKPKPKKWDSKAEAAADKRYYDLATRNRSHFLNPVEGDETRTTVEKADDITKSKVPLNAVAGYSHNHLEAITAAFEAGKAGKGIESALAIEAFGAHYLTDAFASGHLRTPRESVKNYWHSQLPMFNYNLKGFIAEKLAEKLETKVLGGLPSEEAVYKGALGKKGALQKVTEMIDQKGYLTFGDVVSGALHDYDNEKGVMATVEGHKQPIKFMGDGKLGKEPEKKNGKLTGKWVDKPGLDDQEKIMLEAVKAGMDDIVKAWDAGKNSKSKLDLVDLLDQLTKGDGRFAAERLLPKPDLTNQPKWKFPDWEGLLNDSQFQEGFRIFIDDKNSDFKKAAKELTDPVERAAFEQAIIQRLDSEPLKVIKEVINWVPDTGGGVLGHNQDDNSEDYVKLAKRAGAMATLTKEQRRKLILNLFDGKTWGEDETMVMDLLDAADDKDVRYIISKIGWGEMEDELGGKFSKKYPKAQYGK